MNKTLMAIAISALIIGAVYVSQSETNSAFEDWKAQYGANWSAGEEGYRRVIFEKNLETIMKHNADQTQTYKMGINQFTSMTDEEFFNTYLDPKDAPALEDVDNSMIVGDVDWTTQGKVTGVKNQGQCGSCWAFSATGAMESMALLKGQSVSLSEQQLVDCSGSYGNQGCNGGWPSSAMKYVAASGISSESEYPYTAKTGTCQKQGGSFKISTMSSASGCTGIQNALNSAPVSVTVDASNWSRYSSGVFSNCGSSINHAVLMVGVSSSAWKIKNSWGASWGESGYIRLATGNTCGVCAYAGVVPK